LASNRYNLKLKVNTLLLRKLSFNDFKEEMEKFLGWRNPNAEKELKLLQLAVYTLAVGLQERDFDWRVLREGFTNTQEELAGLYEQLYFYSFNLFFISVIFNTIFFLFFF